MASPFYRGDVSAVEGSLLRYIMKCSSYKAFQDLVKAWQVQKLKAQMDTLRMCICVKYPKFRRSRDLLTMSIARFADAPWDDVLAR